MEREVFLVKRIHTSCSSANDIRRVAFTVLLERAPILAHILPPHIIERAWALAADPLALVRAHDHVLDRPAGLDEEHGGVVALLRLPLACAWGAIVAHHLTVECLPGPDGNWLARFLVAGRRGEIASSTFRESGAGEQAEGEGYEVGVHLG